LREEIVSLSLPPAPRTTIRLNARTLKRKSTFLLPPTSTSSVRRWRRFSRSLTAFALRLPVIVSVPRLT
jgi:hypothetical protein